MPETPGKTLLLTGGFPGKGPAGKSIALRQAVGYFVAARAGTGPAFRGEAGRLPIMHQSSWHCEAGNRHPRL